MQEHVVAPCMQQEISRQQSMCSVKATCASLRACGSEILRPHLEFRICTRINAAGSLASLRKWIPDFAVFLCAMWGYRCSCWRALPE